jgi:hypothetical protein
MSEPGSPVPIRRRAILDELDHALRMATRSIDGDSSPIIVDRIGHICGQVAVIGDGALIVETRRRLARLRWRIEHAGHRDSALYGAIQGGLSSLRAARVLCELGDLHGTHPHKPSRTLEARVLDALVDGPKRPWMLAEDLGVHQSQISRAFRGLLNKELITRSSAPTNAPDSRGRWYALRDD